MAFIYLFTALFSTLIGSMVGMGGGVIMKPVMDALGHYSPATINILVAITILSMTVFSGAIQIKNKKAIKPVSLILLAIGSVGGGYLGQFLFDLLTKGLNENTVKLVQNSCLIAILLLIFFYLLFKNKLGTLHLKNPVIYAFTGVGLGVISSFLSIGGGPINVAVLMLLFALDIKTAVLYSLVSIFFTQAAKLVTVFFTTGFSSFDLSVLPYMAAAAIVGGLLGSFIKGKVNEKVIYYLLNGVQVLIMGLCVYNIIVCGMAL